jgi:hypothetical protein
MFQPVKFAQQFCYCKQGFKNYQDGASRIAYTYNGATVGYQTESSVPVKAGIVSQHTPDV